MRFFHQEDLNDCGLACLAMLIHHHQKQVVSPYQLKQLISSQGGITFFDLINLATNFGLRGQAYFCEFELLKNQLQLPILVNIKGKNDLNHFVLLVEMSPQGVRILDPARQNGHCRLTWIDFKNVYLGQILTFQKIKKWQPSIPWKIIFEHVQHHLIWLFFITLTHTMSNYFWFIANFFIRYLELWLITGQLNHQIFIQCSFYFLGGLCYFGQTYGIYCLQQSLWKQVLASHLNKLKITENNWQLNQDFWLVINQQHETLQLLVISISKFLSNLLLLPIIVWIINKTNYWILLICLGFIILNTMINNFCFWLQARTKDQVNWEKVSHYQQIGHYLNNFNNLKKRQYHRINRQQLELTQTKYFKLERRHHLSTMLIDLNYQLTQRVFSFAFWFLIFLLITKQTKLPRELLALSITTQLWISNANDLNQNILCFWYQKRYLYSLLPWEIKTKNSSVIYPEIQKVTYLTFNNFGFETIGHFYQLPDYHLKLPIQICGSQEMLDCFYRAFLVNKSGLLINQQPLNIYENEMFAIDYEGIPIASLVGENLFCGHQIKKEIWTQINLDYWLSRYNLQIYQSIDLEIFSKAQLQLISFLSLLFSDYKLYILNQPLSAIETIDQELLWKLLFQLKRNCHLVILGSIPEMKEIELECLQLDDMI